MRVVLEFNNINRMSKQNEVFKDSCMTPNEVVLWIVFLAETIQPNSEFLLTKALNRQLGNVRQFKRSRKYQNLKQHQFGKMLGDYLNGRKLVSQVTNPVERHLIEYIINRKKNHRESSLEQLKYQLDIIKGQTNTKYQEEVKCRTQQEEEIFDEQESYENIIKIPPSIIKVQKIQTRRQSKHEKNKMNEQLTKDRSQTHKIEELRSNKRHILKSEDLIKAKNTKWDQIIHQDSAEKIQKQYLDDFLNFSINISFKAYPILRKFQSYNQFHQTSPKLLQIAKNISENQHQLNSLLEKLKQATQDNQ